MEHFSDVLKILEGGLKFNAATVVSYAQALKEKLEAAGDAQQARLVQSKLDGAQAALQAMQGSQFNRLPIDQESQLDLATVEHVTPGGAHAILEPHIRSEVDRFIRHVQQADRLVAAGVALSARMLIHGPPGVGKTQLARHIAAELRLPIMTARCDALISSFLGSTSKNIRRLFEHAAERPCVLFLDEFDALAKARADMQELGELKRVVVSLLQNIDALPAETVLLAATNHEQLLDPAVWRRFGYRIGLDLPRAELRAALLAAYLGNFAPEEPLDPAVRLSEGFSGALLREAAEEAVRITVIEGESVVRMAVLLRRIALNALIKRELTPTDSAVGRILLEARVPQRLAAEAALVSLRQIAYIAQTLKEDLKEEKGGVNGQAGAARRAGGARRKGTAGKARRR